MAATHYLLASLCASVLLFNGVAAAATDAPAPRFVAKKYKTVNGHRMAYVELGSGDPIVFLHGNPDHSYIWRNVLPLVEGRGRLIAPDLIGMGDSDKLPPGDPSRYSLQTHANYVAGLLELLGVKRRVTFVGFDWGSAIASMWAYQHRYDADAVNGLVLIEAVFATYDEPDQLPSPSFVKDFGFFQTAQAEPLVLQQNIFVEVLMPSLIMRNLTETEKEAYRRPWKTPGESRRPMLSWPREIPINGEPKAVADIVRTYGKWLKDSPIPKLFIRAVPGVIVVGPFVDIIRGWRNVSEVSVKGLHYVMEDSPVEIGEAIAAWL